VLTDVATEATDGIGEAQRPPKLKSGRARAPSRRPSVGGEALTAVRLGVTVAAPLSLRAMHRVATSIKYWAAVAK
jgi:hypothetical protein